jgi:hypothetical protein
MKSAISAICNPSLSYQIINEVVNGRIAFGKRGIISSRNHASKTSEKADQAIATDTEKVQQQGQPGSGYLAMGEGRLAMIAVDAFLMLASVVLGYQGITVAPRLRKLCQAGQPE